MFLNFRKMLCFCLTFIIFHVHNISYAEVRVGSPISLGSSIQSETVRHAHDSTENSRSEIGIGESVNLTLDCSGFSDKDECRIDPQHSWQTFDDSLGSAVFTVQSTTGDAAAWVTSNGLNGNNVLGGTLGTGVTKGGGSAIIQAVIDDRPAADDDSLIKTKNFTIIVPNGVELNEAIPMCGPSNGQNIIGGYFRRIYKVKPRSVNWQGLTIRENVDAVSFEWPDGTDDYFPAFSPSGILPSTAMLLDDHRTHDRPIRWLNNTAKNIGQSGLVQYYWNFTYDYNPPNGWVDVCGWVHSDAFSSAGVDTMSGNNSSGSCGPFQSATDIPPQPQ